MKQDRVWTLCQPVKSPLKLKRRKSKTLKHSLLFSKDDSTNQKNSSWQRKKKKKKKKKRERELEDKLESLYDNIEDKTQQLQLPSPTGPVAASLDETLKKDNITVQAYHGRSFVGNHCNKYLQEETTKDICQSVVRKAYQLTDNQDVHNKAHGIAQTYQELNCLYARIHKRISHTLSINSADITHTS